MISSFKLLSETIFKNLLLSYNHALSIFVKNVSFHTISRSFSIVIYQEFDNIIVIIFLKNALFF